MSALVVPFGKHKGERVKDAMRFDGCSWPFLDLRAKFIFTHGRLFQPDALTFKGRRWTEKACFRNAGSIVIRDLDHLTYVEGYIACDDGSYIHHAWAMRKDGGILDPTLRRPGTEFAAFGARITADHHEYFGVPFGRKLFCGYLVAHSRLGLLVGDTNESQALLRGEVTDFA